MLDLYLRGGGEITLEGDELRRYIIAMMFISPDKVMKVVRDGVEHKFTPSDIIRDPKEIIKHRQKTLDIG